MCEILISEQRAAIRRRLAGWAGRAGGQRYTHVATVHAKRNNLMAAHFKGAGLGPHASDPPSRYPPSGHYNFGHKSTRNLGNVEFCLFVFQSKSFELIIM